MQAHLSGLPAGEPNSLIQPLPQARWRLGIAMHWELRDLPAGLWNRSSECHGDPREIGFDYAVGFQPDWTCLPAPLPPEAGPMAIERGLGTGSQSQLILCKDSVNVFSYGAVVGRDATKPNPLVFPLSLACTPSWGQLSTERTRCHHPSCSTPDLYAEWLGFMKSADCRKRRLPSHTAFINAWNDVAEGNHLEPDQHWGRNNLDENQRDSSWEEIDLAK